MTASSMMTVRALHQQLKSLTYSDPLIEKRLEELIAASKARLMASCPNTPPSHVLFIEVCKEAELSYSLMTEIPFHSSLVHLDPETLNMTHKAGSKDISSGVLLFIHGHGNPTGIEGIPGDRLADIIARDMPALVRGPLPRQVMLASCMTATSMWSIYGFRYMNSIPAAESFARHWQVMTGADIEVKAFDGLPSRFSLSGSDWLEPASHEKILPLRVYDRWFNPNPQGYQVTINVDESQRMRKVCHAAPNPRVQHFRCQ